MINTTLCYLIKDNCYLMLHRNKKENDLNAGKWIGIGGKFLDGESPEDCLLREAAEETGLTLTEYQFRGIVTFVNTKYPTEYMHLFTATGFSGTQTPCDEGELVWIPIDQMNTLPHWQGDEIFLSLISRPCPFFSLKLCYDGDHLLSAALDGIPMHQSAQGEWII